MAEASVETAAKIGLAGAPKRPVVDRIAGAFRTEAMAGLRLATWAQALALLVIAIWLYIWVPAPRVYFIEICILLFVLGGGVVYLVCKHDLAGPWLFYLVVAVDMILLSTSMFGYDLLIGDPDDPPQMMLRNGTIVYFFLFIALTSLLYSPALVLWAGLVGAISWSIAAYLLWRRPETVTDRVLDPNFVSTDVWIQDVIVLLLVAGTLAGGVWRAKRLVLREALAARERANLARYFAPTMVDQLARSDLPLAAVRAQPVAVLFADIVGFTRLAERQAPEQVIGLLRAFHERLEAAVFQHSGTLDKYLGDGIMATFGTPTTSAQDASNALACAQAMLDSIERWNRERLPRGQPPIRLSIGIHYGEVVQGDIGSERRLEFAIIGDVVNVASRLEALSRRLQTPLVVSDALVQEARRNGVGPGSFDALEAISPQLLPGRAAPVAVWVLRR